MRGCTHPLVTWGFTGDTQSAYVLNTGTRQIHIRYIKRLRTGPGLKTVEWGQASWEGEFGKGELGAVLPFS